MSIFDQLTEDHRAVRRLIDRLKEAAEEAAARETVLAEIKEQLEVHTNFENELFYPAIAENPEARSAVEEAMEEHEEVDALLDELEAAEADWIERLDELEEMLLHHIEAEEGTLFPFAAESLTPARAEELADAHREMKRQEMRRSA